VCHDCSTPSLSEIIKEVETNGDRTGSELVNCCTSHGDHNTLLHLAARNGYAECVRVLLCHGADISVRDKYGRIPKQLIPKQLSSKGVVFRLLRSEGKLTLCDN